MNRTGPRYLLSPVASA